MSRRFATMLKRLRTAKGLSQVELAARARLARPYLIRLESGQQANPSLAVLRRLAKALGVSVSALLA